MGVERTPSGSATASVMWLLVFCVTSSWVRWTSMYSVLVAFSCHTHWFLQGNDGIPILMCTHIRHVCVCVCVCVFVCVCVCDNSSHLNRMK